MTIKHFCRKVFYRFSIARSLIGLASVGSGRTDSLGVSHLLTYTDKKAIGPLQQPEALLLFSIVRTVIPKTIVEFGFHHGHSAFNFLQAMSPDAYLYSYDISQESFEIAKSDFSQYKQFCFLHKSQTEFLQADIDHRIVDLVFFDASHDLQLNQQTFQAVYPALSDESIVCIHDTGLWNKEFFLDVHDDFSKQRSGGRWMDNTFYAHQNDERIFVNWILDVYPRFQSVHLHSSQCLRHGLSILQQIRKLKTA
jgi:predicted O-methyltransferase YrrM